jgi:hypothetical protein
VIEKLKIYCECGEGKYDEGMCIICGMPDKSSWPQPVKEKINEAIEQINKLSGELV